MFIQLCSEMYDNEMLMVVVPTDPIRFGLWKHKPIAVLFFIYIRHTRAQPFIQ